MRVRAVVFDAYGTLYDVQSAAQAAEAAFPGYGDTITRMKQLEYSWLRSLMGRYQDFRVVTRDSLRYTIETLGLTADGAVLDRVAAAWDCLLPYPDAEAALAELKGYRRAILSNGSPAMLGALVRHSGLDRHLDAVISVDAARAYKPDPRAYALVGEQLGVAPAEVVFVTANGFDIAGAASFGFTVVRVERVVATSPSDAGRTAAALFQALRMRSEVLGFAPDAVVASLLDLPNVVAALDAGG